MRYPQTLRKSPCLSIHYSRLPGNFENIGTNPSKPRTPMIKQEGATALKVAIGPVCGFEFGQSPSDRLKSGSLWTLQMLIGFCIVWKDFRRRIPHKFSADAHCNISQVAGANTTMLGLHI